MKFAIVVFPGSNCDHDAYFAVNTCSARGVGRIWHKETDLGGVDVADPSGGFAYGDYLRAGAMAAHSPVMQAVKQFAQRGGPVLGICNGFQILCEAGLLEGALVKNETLRFECKEVYCRVEGRPTPFTYAIPAGRHLRLHIAHGQGRYTHPELDRLEKAGQIVFRYVTACNDVTAAANPNGSDNNIAGVCNGEGNVVGLMPHPERACEAICSAWVVKTAARYSSRRSVGPPAARRDPRHRRGRRDRRELVADEPPRPRGLLGTGQSAWLNRRGVRSRLPRARARADLY